MYCGGFLLQTDPQTWFSFSLRGTWPDLLTSICRESNRSFPSKQPTTTTILPSRRCLEPIDPFPRPIKALFAASVDSNSSEGIVSPEDRCNDRVSLPLLYRRHSSPSGISRYTHNRSFIDRDIALHIGTGDIQSDWRAVPVELYTFSRDVNSITVTGQFAVEVIPRHTSSE